MQEITLAGLYRGGFFDKAAFYGGTCLRIFHELPRFSENMDFSLTGKDETFDLENYGDTWGVVYFLFLTNLIQIGSNAFDHFFIFTSGRKLIPDY